MEPLKISFWRDSKGSNNADSEVVVLWKGPQEVLALPRDMERRYGVAPCAGVKKMIATALST